MGEVLWIRTLLLFSLKCWGGNLAVSWSPSGKEVALRRRRVLRAKGMRRGISLKSLLRILRFVSICRLLCISTLWIQIWLGNYLLPPHLVTSLKKISVIYHQLVTWLNRRPLLSICTHPSSTWSPCEISRFTKKYKAKIKCKGGVINERHCHSSGFLFSLCATLHFVFMQQTSLGGFFLHIFLFMEDQRAGL